MSSTTRIRREFGLFTVTVVFAIIYLGIAEKKELSFLASMPLEQSIAE